MTNGTPDRADGHIRNRLEIVDGLLRALNERGEIDSVVERSADRTDACRRLVSDLQFTPLQAGHILDMQLSSRTRLGSRVLAGERAELLDELEGNRKG